MKFLYYFLIFFQDHFANKVDGLLFVILLTLPNFNYCTIIIKFTLENSEIFLLTCITYAKNLVFKGQIKTSIPKHPLRIVNYKLKLTIPGSGGITVFSNTTSLGGAVVP